MPCRTANLEWLFWYDALVWLNQCVPVLASNHWLWDNWQHGSGRFVSRLRCSLCI